jgi:RNA polymerase sigma-70 factor (ECF subfamily)
MRDVTITEIERLQAEASEADEPLLMDEDAFRAFYDRTARGLWAYLARMTGDREAADDLLQEAYYRFLRSGASHDSDQHRRNYLFRIATNLVRDGRRRQQVRPVTVADTDHALDVSDGVDVAARTEHREDLRRAMAGLRPRDRALLWLAYAQGSSHRDIAQALGLQAGSIKQLLSRARRRLVDRLGGHRPASGGTR